MTVQAPCASPPWSAVPVPEERHISVTSQTVGSAPRPFSVQGSGLCLRAVLARVFQRNNRWNVTSVSVCKGRLVRGMGPRDYTGREARPLPCASWRPRRARGERPESPGADGVSLGPGARTGSAGCRCRGRGDGQRRASARPDGGDSPSTVGTAGRFPRLTGVSADVEMLARPAQKQSPASDLASHGPGRWTEPTVATAMVDLVPGLCPGRSHLGGSSAYGRCHRPLPSACCLSVRALQVLLPHKARLWFAEVG